MPKPWWRRSAACCTNRSSPRASPPAAVSAPNPWTGIRFSRSGKICSPQRTARPRSREDPWSRSEAGLRRPERRAIEDDAVALVRRDDRRRDQPTDGRVMALADRIYPRLPVLAQHAAVSAFGLRWKWRRFGGCYPAERDGFLT